MAWYNIRKKKEEPVKEERAFFFDSLGYNSITSFQQAQAMRIGAVYAATNMISNSCAILPARIVKYSNGKRLEMTEHPLNRVLNLTPNSRYSHYNMMKLMVESVLLKGNAYAYIVRDEKLNVASLELIDADKVTPMVQRDGRVKYLVNGVSEAIDSVNMIHLWQHIDETFKGVSTIRYADKALQTVGDTENLAGTFFKSGAGLMGVLKASAPLTNDQKKQAAESWKSSIQNSQGVAILPQGLDFQSVSVSPVDSELLQSRQYGVSEVARFFGISPILLYDYSHMSYSTLEQVQLSYIQETIIPLASMIEDEFNRKLFKPSELGKLSVNFDYTVLMKADKKTEAEYYNKLLTSGILSINEVRTKLNLEPIPAEDGGDAHFVQISYGSVKNVANGDYIKQTPQKQDTEQDNKLDKKD